MVPATIPTQAGDVVYWFLLDSGADFSVAPRRLAQQVGLDWDLLPDGQVSGVGPGTVRVRLGSLPLRLEGIKVTARCLFADTPSALFILGRADIFDRFAITFDAQRERITLAEST
jgi:predicted aspartyl protease